MYSLVNLSLESGPSIKSTRGFPFLRLRTEALIESEWVLSSWVTLVIVTDLQRIAAVPLSEAAWARKGVRGWLRKWVGVGFGRLREVIRGSKEARRRVDFSIRGEGRERF